MKLLRLAPTGRCLVTRELASGHKPFYSEEEVVRFLESPILERELDAFSAAVDDVLASRERFSTDIDAALAPSLHASLPLTRREAADQGVWRYLAVVVRPDFIRFRWENRSWSTMQTRFWMQGTRPDSNTLGRLWWIAEMSREGDDYSLTREVLKRQTLANSLFVRSFAAHRPVLQAMVELFGDSEASTIERVTRRFNSRLTVRVLETMSVGDVRAELQSLARSSV